MLRFVLLLAALPLVAAEPQGFVHWKASELKGFEKKLAGKKLALEDLAKFGTYWFLTAHREGDGEAELHETETDIFVAQSGEATLVVGGEIENAKTTAPGQVRGSGIKGGTRVKLAPGDVAHIPAKTPHQVVLGGAKQFTYFIVKVETR